MRKYRGMLLAGWLLCAPGCKSDLYIADAVAEGTDPVTVTDGDPGTDSETESVGISDTGSDSGSETDSEVLASRCEHAVALPGDLVRTVLVDGAERTYTLHIPETYTGEDPVPLVVDFHAIGGYGSLQLSLSPYLATTDADGAITAFPDGSAGPIGTAWNIGPCCVDDPNVDDVAFVRKMIADIESIACIESSQVYALGISMGAGMVYRLACEAADLFAATAPSSFDLITETVDDCAPTRGITVLSFRGIDDPLEPYDGGYSMVVEGQGITFLGAVETFNTWVRLNDCSGDPTDLGNGCLLYAPSQCRDGAEVMLCTMAGGMVTGDPGVVWPMLKRHALP